MPELHEILYCSELAPQLPTVVVGHIVTLARARNAADGITGLLVFDGMRFCQHFEGPPDRVLALMERLETDPRHVDVRMLYAGELPLRRYQRFEMGLAEVEDGDELASIRELDGTEALQRFLALRPRFDISG